MLRVHVCVRSWEEVAHLQYIFANLAYRDQRTRLGRLRAPAVAEACKGGGESETVYLVYLVYLVKVLRLTTKFFRHAKRKQNL